jgi:DNA primase
VNFDPDTAGANATQKSIQMLLDEGLHVRVLELGGDLDPDEFVKASGADAYRARLEKAPAYFHWLADRARGKFDMRTVEGRLEGFKLIAPAIQGIADRLERFAVANDVAAYLGLDEKLVREQFSHGPKEHRAPAKPVVPLEERILLKALLASEEARVTVIPGLREATGLTAYATKNILNAMFSMHEDGAPYRFADLEGRLSETDRDLLSTVIFADDRVREDEALRVATDCLRRLKGRDPQAALADLRAQVKAAERAGDMREAMRLNALVTQIDEHRKQSRELRHDVVH